MRACALEITPPPGLAVAREGESSEVHIASVDASGLPSALLSLRVMPNGGRIAWALPVAREGARGALAWIISRSRRLRPIALEDACDALRRAGVVDLRVTTIDGSAGLAVLSGRICPRLDAPGAES